MCFIISGTLRVNGLDSSIKKQTNRMDKKCDLTICFLQETNLRLKETGRK